MCVSVQVLEVLWELAHLPTLPTSLVQQALEEHLGILSDAYAVKELVKRSYIIKCIEDIKKVRQTKYSIFFVYLGSCWGLAFHCFKGVVYFVHTQRKNWEHLSRILKLQLSSFNETLDRSTRYLGLFLPSVTVLLHVSIPL